MRTTLIVATMVAGGFSGAVAADAIHIQELNAMKDRWPAMAKDERRISLEGRFGGRAGRLLRLQNSELVFRVEEGVRLPKMRSGRNVEIIGHLREHDNQIDFVVQRIAGGDSDLEKLARKQKELPKKDAKAWYALAQWAEDRAAFYDDSEMLKQSRAIVREAFEIERTNIAKGDASALRILADRVTKLGLNTSLRNEMIHESLRWRWQKLTENRKVTLDERVKFLAVLEKELKNCTQPVRLADQDLRRDYALSPERTYREATLSNQLLMHRFFYHDVLLPVILAEVKPDGSNGHIIARELRSRIPEEAELAAGHEAAELQYRVGIAESLTRSDMIDLVSQLEAASKPKLAMETKRRWVIASEKRLTKRGPAGLVQAANEYDTLLGDRQRAIRLLKRAWEESPEKEEIEQRLQRYDLYRRNDQWMSKVQVDALPQNQMEKALREGRVIRGMNLDQVRRTLGEPDRVSRFGTRSKVQIVWSFVDASSNRISVLFERRVTDAVNVARVISVGTLPAR